MSEPVVTVKEYEELLVALDLAHRNAHVRMIQNGMPRPESFPPLQISAIIVPDAAAFNAVRRENIVEGTPSEQEEIVPEIRTVRKNTDKATKLDTSRSQDTAVDTGEDNNTSIDSSDETASRVNTDTSTDTQSDTSSTQEQRGESQLTENRVLV